MFCTIDSSSYIEPPLSKIINMKSTLLFLFLLINFIHVTAQNLSVSWLKQFGGLDYEHLSLDNQVNGALNVIGSFYGTCNFYPTSSALNLTSAGSGDGFIVRFVQCSAVCETVQAHACRFYDFNI